MRKRKIKRFAEGKEVEIEDRSTKSDRLKAEELGKGPMDYATLGARARASSPFSGPREYITESKEEAEGPVSEGISAGKGARNLAVEETEKVTPTKKVTKTVVKKKPAESRYEDTGAKIGSQGGFKFESKAEPESRARSAAEIRAGKAAAPETPSKIPKNTFLTPERLESSRKSYYSGFESKPVRSAADIRAGRGMKAGGKTSSASSRADGCAQRGKTRGKMV
jgi:hypothetical protein